MGSERNGRVACRKTKTLIYSTFLLPFTSHSLTLSSNAASYGKPFRTPSGRTHLLSPGYSSQIVYLSDSPIKQTSLRT